MICCWPCWRGKACNIADLIFPLKKYILCHSHVYISSLRVSIRILCCELVGYKIGTDCASFWVFQCRPRALRIATLLTVVAASHPGALLQTTFEHTSKSIQFKSSSLVTMTDSSRSHLVRTCSEISDLVISVVFQYYLLQYELDSNQFYSDSLNIEIDFSWYIWFFSNSILYTVFPLGRWHRR